MFLDSTQIIRLKAGINSAFNEYEVLRQYISDYCAKELNEHVHKSTGLIDACHKLIEWAETEGWLTSLLSALHLHSNPTLKKYVSDILEDNAKKMPYHYRSYLNDPFNTLYMASEECFIGRDEFREHLKQLRSDESNRNVLMVSGMPCCGKSYSFQLLRTLDKFKNENIVILIDFKEFRMGALDDRYREIAMRISTRLNISIDKISAQFESNTRWFEHVIRIFENSIRDKNKKLWLVFDSIRFNSIVEPSVADALAKLVAFAQNESHSLRLVLIDVAKSDLLLEKSIASKIATDSASLPEKKEIIDFFLSAQKYFNKDEIKDDDLQDAADQIFYSLDNLAENDKPYMLSKYTWDHSVRLGLVS